MSEPMLLSNSEMKSFRRCRRQWYLQTYRRLRPRVEPAAGSPLSIGNLVHDALAAYYDPEQKADPVAHVQAAIEADLETNPAQTDALIKERALAVIMLEGYLDWLQETGADADLKITGSERMAEVKLVEGVHLISKLDAPVERESDGARLVLEHKTVQSLDLPLPLLKLDTQLLTEHLVRFLQLQEMGATKEEAQEACHGVLYNMLRKVKRTAQAKPPFYGREDVPHNIYELRNHWKHCLSVAIQIQETRTLLDEGHSHHAISPPNPTRDCKWDCDFFKVCVLLDDGSDAEGALEALYEERDPLERYEGAVVLDDSLGG